MTHPGSPEVSVIVPFYNRTLWLLEAVQSVMSQTFPDFELIVVDDGSDEGPDFSSWSDDARFRYVRQEHRGKSATRNHGIEVARGKYIAFLDSDDLFMPDKLEQQVPLMESHSAVLLSHTSYLRIDEEGTALEEIRSGRFSGDVRERILLLCPIATSTVMVRRTAIQDSGWFVESAEFAQDVILWIELGVRAPILGIDEVLTKFRMHRNVTCRNLAAIHQGQLNVIEHAIRNNQDLSPGLRRRVLSSKYLSLSQTRLKLGNVAGSISSLLRALATWPSNPRIYKSIIRGVLSVRRWAGRR